MNKNLVICKKQLGKPFLQITYLTHFPCFYDILLGKTAKLRLSLRCHIEEVELAVVPEAGGFLTGGSLISFER